MYQYNSTSAVNISDVLLFRTVLFIKKLFKKKKEKNVFSFSYYFEYDFSPYEYW